MLKILVKKQLAEIFRMYLYNAKKNKSRSKVSTALMFVFFGVIMLGVLGGMFTALALAMQPLVEMKMGWFYYLLFTILAIFLGAFGSVFNTFSGLYLAKDNDLLLAMPIPVSTLIASRLVSVFLMGVMYSSVVMLPAVIVYWITAGPSAANILGAIVWMLVIWIIILALSCILGYAVARLSTKMKHKNITTVVLAIVFIGLYYFVYFKAAGLLQNILANAMQYGAKMKDSLYLLYKFGCVPTGDFAAMAVAAAAAVLLLAVIWYILSRSFIKIATSTGRSAKVKYKEKTAKQKSVFGAMLGKEFARFTGSANYMLNCGMGILMLILTAGFVLVKGSMVGSLITSVFEGEVKGALTILCIGMIIMLASMNDMVAPSVALEGKNIWISHSLPVPAKTALRAKLAMHLILTCIPVLICSLVFGFVFRMSLPEKVMIILIPQAAVLLEALFGLFMGMLNPNLKWTSEVYPIKQSLTVAVALFAGWVIGIGTVMAYLLWLDWLGVIKYLCLVLGVLLVLILVLVFWFEKKAPAKFEEL